MTTPNPIFFPQISSRTHKKSQRGVVERETGTWNQRGRQHGERGALIQTVSGGEKRERKKKKEEEKIEMGEGSLRRGKERGKKKRKKKR
jgi:hypothetical protein